MLEHPVTQTTSDVTSIENTSLRLFIIALSCSLIYILMVGLLRDKRNPDARYPSTFFSLDQMTSVIWFRSICFFFAGSLSVLYAAVALDGGHLLTATRQLLLSYAEDQFSADRKEALKSLFDSVPDWLNPIFVLACFLLLFSNRTRKGLTIYRDTLISAAGLYSIVDETSLDLAKTLIDRHPSSQPSRSYDEAIAEVSSLLSRDTPVPEPLVNEKNEKRLAYQLIWLQLKQIREQGLVQSFDAFRSRIGLPPIVGGGLKVNLVHLVSAGFVFFLLMGLFTVITPVLKPLAHYHAQLFNWPDPNSDGWSATIRYILKNTLGFVFPLMLALNMYPVRRRAYLSKESAVTSFVVVATIQWVLAFCVHEVFNVLDKSVAMSQHNDEYSLLTPKLHVTAFLLSFIPLIAFGLILFVRLCKPQRTTTQGVWTTVVSISVMTCVATAISAIVGISFALCDVVYECYLQRFDYYFVYQCVLGSYMSVAFFIAGSVTEQLPLGTQANRLRAP
jgi:uncharacterized membrane protein